MLLKQFKVIRVKHLKDGLEIMRFTIFHIFEFFVIFFTYRAEDNCTCEYKPEDDGVGPFCSQWIPEDPPFCYLSGGDDGKFCPGAVKATSGNYYWTEDASICLKSINYVENNCNCHYYEQFDWAGSYCSNWIDEDPSFYFLAG